MTAKTLKESETKSEQLKVIQSEKASPRLDDRFIKNIKGKDFVLYAGVLDLATQKGLLKLEVELIQFPTKENGFEAICHAVAVGKDGEVFSDVGDANPNNCAPLIAKHLIRMASTRSKARALRDYCSIDIACLEELESMDDVIGSGTPKRATRKKAAPKSKPVVAEKKTEAKVKQPSPANSKSENLAGPQISDAQRRAIFNLSRRRGISVENLEKMSQERFAVTVEKLKSKEASGFIKELQQAA